MVGRAGQEGVKSGLVGRRDIFFEVCRASKFLKATGDDARRRGRARTKKTMDTKRKARLVRRRSTLGWSLRRKFYERIRRRRCRCCNKR